MDSSLNKYHSVNLLGGLNIYTSIFEEQIGLKLEGEYYKDISTVNSNLLINSYKEDLILTPVWLSLVINARPIYLGVGEGITHSTLNIENSPTGITDNFMSYQIFAGYSQKPFDITLKYSFVRTDPDWGNVDLGGLSLLMSVYF